MLIVYAQIKFIDLYRKKYLSRNIYLNREIMKRYSNLYKNICDIRNIENSFKEVRKNTRNERRVFNMKQYKTYYISSVYNILINHNYKVGKYNKFIIHEPKERVIVSQNVVDKIVNHLVARYILYPAILPCLLDVNVASRINLGTAAGLNIAKEYRRICNVKYKEYYILKCDISKFFSSINHERLKQKIRRRIKEKESLEIIEKIIDSNEPGLFIGSMTSQVLAIFYLNDMDHFIKEKLKIKYYIRYQDDFLLFHPSKKYLQYCYNELKQFLTEEKLTFNKKTRIYKNTDNYAFLGRNKYGKYIRYRNVKRKLKARKYMYLTGKIPLSSYIGSIICYEELLNKRTAELISGCDSME